jgi:predicted N-acyltransferase
MLHFECCYYAGIDYCIAQGLSAFDAGAQGEHKLQRGFVPVIRSGFYRFLPAHSTAGPALAAEDLASIARAELLQSMHNAIANYCLEEQSMVLNYQQQARQALPFAHLTSPDALPL